MRYAISAWLTISIGINAWTRRPPEWNDGETLKVAITRLFEKNVRCPLPSNLDQQQLPEDLTAASLTNYYGFSIHWIHDLNTHLSIDWKNEVLNVYEHKILAYNHARYPTPSLPVPDQLFEEVIDTLNLLFPFQDGPTKKLLAEDNIAFHGLGLCGRPRKLVLNDYHFFKGQIADLHGITQGPSIGLQQLFLDDDGKNLISTFNFWIVATVGLLTILGMAIAIASLVYSVKQYNLAWKEYELDVAQACGDSSVRELVPHLCPK